MNGITLHGDWIWFSERSPHENVVGCFAHVFRVDDPAQVRATLRISAETRYQLCLNGEELGRGPIRSFPGQKHVDAYDISALLLPGENLIAARVWDYGWSTYQSIGGRGALIFDVVDQHGRALAQSGADTRAVMDAGHRWNAPKRNANLGFMEIHDARLSPQHWQRVASASRDWLPATPLGGLGIELSERPVPLYSQRVMLPARVSEYRLVKHGCQQISVNTRAAFFPGRIDADETTFSGFLGVVIESDCDMAGRIAFPNRAWNGLIGDFTIGGRLYPVDSAHRDVEVSLSKGRQLFLMQISGKSDDLFCHIEFAFDAPLRFSGVGEAGFFVIGPTGLITTAPDGRSRIYGGLEEFDRLESHTEAHRRLFACATLEALRAAGAELIPIHQDYVFFGDYLWSLARNHVALAQPPVPSGLFAMLGGSADAATLPPPSGEGAMHRVILDFGDIYVGALEFSLAAAAGTTLDFYGFENRFEGEIDFTVGLNNAIRYVCREGAQRFSGMTRLGCRYLMITIANQTGPVNIQSVGIRHATYPSSGEGFVRTDDEKLNAIFQMCRQTHLNCMEDTFTDCPTYEQSFWTGDALISAHINAWLYGSYPLMRHSLTMAAGNARNTPLMNALGPTDWTTFIPMWSMNWLLGIEQYIDVSGDMSILSELYPSVRKLMGTFASFVGEDGGFLINAWNMLDWAAMDISNHCVVTGQQAVLVDCCRAAARFAEQQGVAQDAATYRSIAERLKRYIDEALWDEERQAFLDGWSPERGLSKTASVQSHTLLALYNAIDDPKKRALAEGYLKNPPADFVLPGSPFFLFYVYESWARRSLGQVIDDVRTRWTDMMRYDCTTCWEVFPGFYEVGRTRSYCHSWSASPAYFFERYLLGIQSFEPGFDSITFSIPDTDLSWCEGAIPTPHGRIEVRWSKENGQNTACIRLPREIECKPVDAAGWEIKVERFD